MTKRIDLITDLDISVSLDGETDAERMLAVRAHIAASPRAAVLAEMFRRNDDALRALRRTLYADADLRTAVSGLMRKRAVSLPK